MEQRFQWKKMTVGVCYYPEHWPEHMWRDDLRRMLENGITVVRMGEFAWSLFEKREGEFDFDFFDRFLSLCREEGMQVIFGTPTATPPAWLTEKYPEVLNCDAQGTPYRHGGRRHYNYNSPVYLEKCALITRKLAERYGGHPAIVGWQLDNEINCETCEFFSEADTVAFRAFLREKYGTLDALNEAWGTVFWSQTYTEWEEIHVPRPTPIHAINPHLALDYSRFVSHSAIRFCRVQADILRRYVAPGVFITTNGLFPNLDNHRFMDECLDVYTYDSYPNFAYELRREWHENAMNDRMWSLYLTQVRSVCPHYGVMEQQSGPGGWYNRMETSAPRPGQLKLWAMQSVANGADFVSFFRWRTCTFGTEIYWHGILDYDSRDNRRLGEVREFARMMDSLQPLCGSEFVASFAVVKDYDNIFDARCDTWHERVESQSETALFEAAQRLHMPFDMLFLRDGTTAEELLRYPVLIAPHAVVMTPRRAEMLKEYVRAGGTLVIGCRTGLKDERGHCVMQPQPGLLAEISGTTVEEFTLTHPAYGESWADWDGEKIETPVFNDILEAEGDAQVLARFGAGYYAGKPALVENRVGKGRVLHLGSAFSLAGASKILRYTGVRAVADMPEEIETVLRRDREGREYLFLLNDQHYPVSLTAPAGVSQLTGQECGGAMTLPAYGVEVIRLGR